MIVGTFDLLPVAPEILVAVMGMLLLVLGVFLGDKSFRLISWYTVLSFAVTAALLLRFPDGTIPAFGGLFISEPFAVFMKILVLFGGALSVLMAMQYAERQKIARFEYPVLVLFSVLGMMMMLSANDLISLYMGLELQSLPLYVLAALNRDSLKSSEAGVKYFVLGALSSGLLLYGCSMVYGFAGTTSFPGIADSMSLMEGTPSMGLVIGLVFMLSGLAFKVSAVPFHMWTPDVYEGAPASVVSFFAMVPKIAAMGLLVRLTMSAFGGIADQWQQVIWVIAAGSMIVGAFAALRQTNIRRLLAYSSIGHMGYALIGLAAASAEGVRGLMLYMVIYMITTGGVFAVILMMTRRGQQAEEIDDLAGLAKYNPIMAACMALLMFSMAGIPPVAGFFGKLFIFQAAVAQGLYCLAIIGVLSSVVAAYYYLRVIRVMYFDEPVNELDRVDDAPALFVMRGATVFALIFAVIIWPVFETLTHAVERLLGA